MGKGGNHLLVADAEALPALALRLRGLGPEARAIVVAERALIRLETSATLTLHWVDRFAAFGPRSLNDAVKALFLPQDGLWAWIACAAPEARLIEAQLADDHGVRRDRIETPGLDPVLHILDALA